MYRKEVNTSSPLRILEKSMHGGLGNGNLGVVMARAGVGKTACLIQMGLDDLMRDRPVLHVALGQTVEHVQCWYDALYDDLAERTALENRDIVAATVAQKRIIVAFPDHDLWPDRLKHTVELFKQSHNYQPAAVLVDGFDWSAHTVAETAALLGAFKAYANIIDAELWMTAQTHRENTGEHPMKLPAAFEAYAGLIDVALFLEPSHDAVTLRLLKDHDNEAPHGTHLTLHPDTLRLKFDGDSKTTTKLPNSAFTLMSGGAQGAEQLFGEQAEKHGVSEVTYSFAGRNAKRNRGLVNLSEDELSEGTVSPIYVQAQMHRTYPNTPLFRKTLASIWHQVTTAGEVFTVGWIKEDDTVKGGTGWAAELGRHWNKPVHVYDQERKGWFTWDGNAWVAEEPPRITSRRFTGTGTRFLTDEGRQAIEELFARSFE